MVGAVTLVIATLACVATAFDVENATDYPGHDIIRPPKKVATYTDCEEMCVANSECAGECSAGSVHCSLHVSQHNTGVPLISINTDSDG
jgi:hypothetical protein